MKTFCGILAVLLLSLSGSVWAAPEAPAADPRAVLTDGMKYAKGLDSLSVDLAIKFQFDIGDKKTNGEMKGTIILRGTKDFYGYLKTDKFEVEFFCNAEKQMIYVVSDKKYIDKTCSRQQLMEIMGGGPIGLVFSWLTQYVHDEQELLSSAADVTYAGLEQPGGEGSPKQHHVTMKYPEYAADAWITEGAAPLLQRCSINLTEDMGPEGKATAVVDLVLSSWKTNTVLPDNRFSFTPPEGVTKMEPPAAQEEKDTLLGQPAPNVTLDLMDGGKLDLASLKGKNVVVLDFFATWCGPCRMSMPTIEEVAKKYADKGVVLYAINTSKCMRNVDESPELIRSFLQRLNISPLVAVDNDCGASKAYAVSGIPRIVIIGKDGVVYGSHNGLAPDYREQIATEIEAALAGKMPVPGK